MASGKVDLDGNPMKSITICMIGAEGFIGSHICKKIMAETWFRFAAVGGSYPVSLTHALKDSSGWQIS